MLNVNQTDPTGIPYHIEEQETPPPKKKLRCLSCPIDDQHIEELELGNVWVIDEKLHLCSRCINDVDRVTLAILRQLTCLGDLAATDLVERLEKLEAEMVALAEHVSAPPADDEGAEEEDPVPELGYVGTPGDATSLCLRLFAHRDELLGKQIRKELRYAVDDESAALTRRLNGQQHDLDEVRRLLGLQTSREAGAKKGTLGLLLGALGGAVIGVTMAMVPKPLELVRVLAERFMSGYEMFNVVDGAEVTPPSGEGAPAA